MAREDKRARAAVTPEAIEAAAEAIQEVAHTRDFKVMAEAAATQILEDMRPMTEIEKAARDRPEAIAAARQQVRTERASAMSERLRAEREKAWNEGFEAGSAWDRETSYPPTNPHEVPRG